MRVQAARRMQVDEAAFPPFVSSLVSGDGIVRRLSATRAGRGQSGGYKFAAHLVSDARRPVSSWAVRREASTAPRCPACAGAEKARCDGDFLLLYALF